MKIPSVQYGGVQALGRQDVTAPLRTAAAEAGATRAWSQALNQGVESFDQIVDMRAKDRAVQGMNAYNETKLAWQAEQEYYDANGESATDNGAQRFNDSDDAARKTASDFLGNDQRAQYYFNEAADKANIQYGDAWHRKVLSWHKDEQFGVANQAMEIATQKRNFDAVDLIVNDYAQRGVFTRVQAEKLISNNDANRVKSDYGTAIEMTTTPEDAMALRDRIKNESKFSDEARMNYEERLDNQLIATQTDGLRQAMTIIENEVGLTAAVVGGDAAIHEIAKMVEEADTGFATDKARQSNRNALRSVWQEWKGRLEKQTGTAKRINSIQCVNDGTCLPTTGKSNSRDAHDDYADVAIGRIPIGKRDIDNNGIENTVILAKEEEGQRLRNTLTTLANKNGYASKTLRQTIDAGLTSPDAAHTRAAVQMYQRVNDISPATMEGTQSGIVKEFGPVMQTFDEDRAVASIQKYKALTDGDRTRLRESFDAKKVDDDVFSDLMKAEMPVTGWVFDSVPGYKDTFKREVENKARMLMPFVDGDIGAAYKAAIVSTKNTYDVDQHIGTVVKKPFATSLAHGNIDGGKWAHDLIEQELPSFNEGDMPDSYTYAPTPDFDPISNPSYVISWLNEDGEYKAIGADFHFNETEQGKAYFKDLAEEEQENARLRKAQIDQERFLSGEDNDAPLEVRFGAVSQQLKEVGGIVTNALSRVPGAVWDKMSERVGVIGDKFGALGEVRLKTEEEYKREGE